ncbi:uncharacterized protein LOC101852433 [Aplysia californica]|uniref:Uncharacterized protein LOC101852433 n=1 Tax=Aplysia californica TaxID=6500 RepID=A0ABM1A8X8_APLCA|nr:uncharacterized protein LOC101852433 [Aplysia californica]
MFLDDDRSPEEVASALEAGAEPLPEDAVVYAYEVETTGEVRVVVKFTSVTGVDYPSNPSDNKQLFTVEDLTSDDDIPSGDIPVIILVEESDTVLAKVCTGGLSLLCLVAWC